MKESQDRKTKVTEITRIIEEDNKKYLVDEMTGEAFEILVDKSSTGKERQWKKHKEESLTVSECYLALFKRENLEYWYNKAIRLRSCGSYLTFNVYDGIMKIKHADSCRVRLCPLCSWRRSVKIYAHTRKILESMQKEDKYEYLLLTLTVPNTTADNLNNKLDEIMKAWNKLIHYSKFEKAVKGWYRGLEVTHNVNKKSKSYDTYHPHYHCIIAVNRNSFKDNYIKRDDWLSMWRKATRDNSITQVDIRKVKPKIGNDITGAICEVTKYTVKNEDYIVPKNWQLTLDSVKTLDRALKKRRLVAYGGVMKEWHKKLNLDDEIDGDLMKDVNESDNKAVEVTYFWNVSYQQYLKKSY